MNRVAVVRELDLPAEVVRSRYQELPPGEPFHRVTIRAVGGHRPLLEWARGRPLDEIMALDALDVAALEPFFEALGGPGKPDDAREKFQYALVGVQNAVRDHRGEATLGPPEIDEPLSDKDWAVEEEE